MVATDLPCHPPIHSTHRGRLAGAGWLATLLVALLVPLSAPLLGSAARAATPADLLAGDTAQAGAPAQAVRGQRFFTAPHGREWSCASCHAAVPTRSGRHADTRQAITALAPAFNPARFTDPAKVETWFRRNCHDVAARACTPAEKADLLAWLISLQP